MNLLVWIFLLPYSPQNIMNMSFFGMAVKNRKVHTLIIILEPEYYLLMNSVTCYNTVMLQVHAFFNIFQIPLALPVKESWYPVSTTPLHISHARSPFPVSLSLF